MHPRVLIIEPDRACRGLYGEALPAAEFLLRFENTGERGLECAFSWNPACVLLESDLPGLKGLEACRILKADPRTRRTPVCFVSSATGQSDVVEGLKAGADEYLAKPFHPTEILWRVRGLIRRYDQARVDADPVLRCGRLELDSEQGIVHLRGRRLPLTPKEFALLATFLRRPDRVLKRRFLLESVWGYDAAVRTRVVDVTLFRLRRKLGADGACLESLPGFGYRLSPKIVRV